MKKIIYYVIIFFLLIGCVNLTQINTVFATPETAINQTELAQTLLIKLQQNQNLDDNIERMYKYLDLLCQENTQYFSFKIKEIENLMEKYREHIILTARTLAQEKKYKNAVEFLESKSGLFKDKTTINSLITFYSKHFIKDGLFFCDISPQIFAINKLIAYPTSAFNDNPKSEQIDNLHLTTKEFSNFLSELYVNNYVLIDILDYLDLENETIIKRDLYLPENKKPLILLFNNISYNENDSCFIDKFIIDPKEHIATFSAKQPESNQISYSADFIPILENFIDENPDFSQNNARGIISFSNNDNILGYNISKNNPNLNSDLLTLKKLMTNLKTSGYKFAYGDFDGETSYNEHLDFVKTTLPTIFSNINIFISSKNSNYINNFYKELNTLGFKIFFDKSLNKPLCKFNFAFLSYTQIDGNFLRKNSDYLGLNFDKVYDHNNRPTIY